MKQLDVKLWGLSGFVCFAGCILLWIGWPANASAQEAPRRPLDEMSCLRFVQKFYHWYVPLTKGNGSGSPLDFALRQKPELFNSVLLNALKVDADASVHAHGYIDGLDFDPFLGSQDPADHYESRSPICKSNSCFVEIWALPPRDSDANVGKPEVIAEVALERGRWKFLNFHYPDAGTELLAVLKKLAKDREKH